MLALACTGLRRPSVARAAQVDDWRARWPWGLDADGDGRISETDMRIVQACLGLSRGGAGRPRGGWNPRADVLGMGRVDGVALAAVREHLGLVAPPRPLVTCWHYGWYRRRTRRRDPVTMRYRGGAYASSERTTEEEFNRLKTEFGIDIDMLSWIDAPHVLHAYDSGYLSARNLDSRRFGLLYEPLINMKVSGRIDFTDQGPYADRLVADFAAMGRWLAQAARRGRPMLMDGRPMIYLFGSHTFGRHGNELPAVGRALTRARAAFTEAFGAPPWLIGDEALFPADHEAGPDRLFRASYFDAITRYHHYDEAQVRSIAAEEHLDLDEAHRQRLAHTERRTMEAFAHTRCRFTDQPVLVIPSSAAGFAKRGMPRVRASRDQYAAWLREAQGLIDAHVRERHRSRLATPSLPAPLVIVGSWNEEYEGHALMPSSWNQAMSGNDEDGFAWLHALRELYGLGAGR
jgi:hypothetical protein